MKGGKTSYPGKVKVFGSFEQFLDQEHADYAMLFALVDYDIVEGARGNTLLVPEKSFLKDLLALYKGDKDTLTKYEKEAKMVSVTGDELGPTLVRWFLQAMILTMTYTNADSFKNGTVVNKLFQTYELKSVSGDKVILDIGELTPSKTWKGISKPTPKGRNKMAVWDLKGIPKLDTPMFEPPERRGGCKAVKLDKSALVTEHVWYKVCCGKKEKRDVELVYLVSLLNHVRNINPELFAQLSCVISWDPLVTLCLILQPGKVNCCVPEEILISWCKDTYFNVEANSKEKYDVICEEACKHDMVLEEEKIEQIKMLELNSDLDADAILRSYNKIMQTHFPFYKNNIALKVNHDMFKLHYADKDYDFKTMRRLSAQEGMGQHTLNPSFVSVDKSDDFLEFIKGPWFLHHIRLDQDKVTNNLTSPAFEFNQKKLDSLMQKMK
jgi:hypothetical protein